MDPSVSILSTARVPPQQKSWWIQELKEEVFLHRFPAEIVELIASFIPDEYLDVNAAREIRKDFNKRRDEQPEDNLEYVFPLRNKSKMQRAYQMVYGAQLATKAARKN